MEEGLGGGVLRLEGRLQQAEGCAAHISLISRMREQALQSGPWRNMGDLGCRGSTPVRLSGGTSLPGVTFPTVSSGLDIGKERVGGWGFSK